MITRALPTLYLLAAGFILGLTTACVYACVAAWDRRRDARRAERSAKPHSARVGSPLADRLAILRARVNEAHSGNGNAEDCPICRPLIDVSVFYPWLCTGATEEQRHG